jgi:hypothetical protein
MVTDLPVRHPQRQAGKPMAPITQPTSIFTAPAPVSLWQEPAETTCETRGFHGPFILDRSRRAEQDVVTCAACGKRLPTAEHLAAYQIARFHGLVR